MAREKYTDEDIVGIFGKMFISENKTAKQIAEETGYSIHTVRKYLQLGGYKKRESIKEKPPKIEKQKEPKKSYKKPPTSTRKGRPKGSGKPYKPLYGNLVIYNGEIYEKLTKEQLMELLMLDLDIKK